MRPVDPRLLQAATPARRFLATTVAASLATTVTVLLQAQLLAHLLADVSTGRHLLVATAALLAVVLAGRAVLAYAVEVSALRAAATVRSQLRRDLLAAVVRRGPAWLTRQSAGQVTTLATRGLDALDTYFARYLPQLVLACVVPLAVLARIGGADWISMVVIAATLPLIPLFLALVGLHTRASTTRQWETLARLGGHFLDVVGGLPTLTVFGRARAQAQVIRAVSERNRQATMGTLRIAFLSALVLELLATLATAVVAVEIGLRLLAGHLSYETALLVLLLAPEAYLPLRAVGGQFHASLEGAAAAGAVLDIVADTADQPGHGRQLRCDLRRDPIVLDAVTVHYDDRGAAALDAAALTVQPGERVALVGASGAGKSTVLGVLLRFCDPSSGTVTVAGTCLSELDIDRWRAQIAWVPQRPHLFVGTVADNIRLARPAATRAEVDAAVSAAGLHLPGGLETPVAEGGVSLSSGQRQRVALARAFLRDAPLLLLDEPTAHLDRASADELRGRFRTLMAGRTVVVVTHDPAWYDEVDRIVTLDAGRILEADAACRVAVGA